MTQLPPPGPCAPDPLFSGGGGTWAALLAPLPREAIQTEVRARLADPDHIRQLAAVCRSKSLTPAPRPRPTPAAAPAPPLDRAVAAYLWARRWGARARREGLGACPTEADVLSGLHADVERARAAAAGPAGSDRLWTDKYAPGRSSDVSGNTAAVGALATWLRGWAERIESEKTAGPSEPAAKKG